MSFVLAGFFRGFIKGQSLHSRFYIVFTNFSHKFYITLKNNLRLNGLS